MSIELDVYTGTSTYKEIEFFIFDRKIGMSKTLICSQRHTIYRRCNNFQLNILFRDFAKLAFCSSI